MAGPQDANATPTTAGQARASPGRGPSPASSPRAAAVIEDAQAHGRGRQEDKIFAMLDALS
uniref:Uncharacterized protein n=1 Tax=Peronospora matthiolae TaxID=2874970 RepID=A0AAV1TGD3_9STRA